MALTLPPASMTVEEKILVTAVWHGEVLAQREQAVKNGADRFEDWEQAKKDIRKDIP